MNPGGSPHAEVLDWCRRVFGASRDPYALLDAEGRYLWFNDASTALFGYTPEEVVGTHFRDHLVQGELAGEVFARALGGHGGNVVRHIRRKDGVVAPVQAELLPAADGMILVHATDLREIFSDIRQLGSNTVLQALLASSPDGIWLMDANLRLVQFNQRAADLLRSMNGKEPTLGATFGEGNAPDGLRDLVKQLGIAARSGRHMESVQTFIDREKASRVFRFNVFPLTVPGGGPVLGIAFAIREITEQVEAERLARERLSLLTQSESIAGTGTWIYRLDDRHTEWTEGMYRLVGLPVEGGPDVDAYIGRVHPIDRDRVRETLAKRRKGEGTGASSAYRIVLPSGETRWLNEFISVERDSQGHVSMLVGTMQDVTDQVVAEEYARQAERMDAITRVVGGVAHDLNNYLSSILGPIDLIRAGDGRVDYWLSMAEGSARRAASVVSQLVQLVRPTPLRFERFSLAETIADAIDATGVSPQPAFRIPDSPIEIAADRERIMQVLATLLTNAGDAVRARAADAGPAYAPAIDVIVTAEVESVWLAVTDNGIGMDDEARRRALDPYFSTKRSGHALGLSLAIAHRTVTEHHGRLDIQSTPGVGTTVTVTLPRAPLTDAGQPPSAMAEARAGARILVVDDEAAMRVLEVAVLEDAGHSAIAVASGDAAIQACREQEFDLVLLNVQMPGRDGLETFDRLHAEHPALRVAMVTGSDISAHVANRRVAGVVRKPWTAADLVQSVKTFL